VSKTSGSGGGALPIPLPNGRVLILQGNNTAKSSIYDPVTNTMSAGPDLNTGVVGAGSYAIPRPDGTYLVYLGTSSNSACTAVTTVLLFDPFQMTFRTSGLSSVGGGYGSVVFQRSDGTWVHVRANTVTGGTVTVGCGPVTSTVIMKADNDPKAVTGPTITIPGGNVRFEGNIIIPRPDNTWTAVWGGATSTVRTQHYLENEGAHTTNLNGVGINTAIGVWLAGATGGFWTGGVTPTIATGGLGTNAYGSTGPGATAFQLDNGKFIMIGGAASSTASSTAMFEYNGGWASTGKYVTEAINIPDLSSDSVLNWKVTGGSFDPISAEVRTAPSLDALATATPRVIEKPGSKINPGTGDTYLQATFIFRRTFPSYGGIWEDVWTGNGPTQMVPLRKIATPIITEVSVTKDSTLLDLQADGISYLRVTSSGDVYGASGGTINTSGADLAERYTSEDQLDLGEVVSIDPKYNHGVKRSKYQYQPDVIGVVSTDPGFVTGAYTKGSYPIALVGRVPVKVSTENGMIRSGDYLTAASVPGYAMKATVSTTHP
jgi:hypothetical protein